MIAVRTLLLMSVYIAASKEYFRRIQFIFTLLESAFHYLFRPKFLFKVVTFSKKYARKQKWLFFLNTVFVDWSQCPKVEFSLLTGKCYNKWRTISYYSGPITSHFRYQT